MTNYQFPIIIEKGKDVYYIAKCPVIQGCYTQAKSYREVLKRIKEAIELHIETRHIKVDFISGKDLLAKA